MARAIKKDTSELYSETYSDFLDKFQERIKSKPLTNDKFKVRSDTKLTGLFNLFASFSGAAIHDYELDIHKEWNPFSQRPYFSKTSLLKSPSIFNTFDAASKAVDGFIETAHESTHVLLWEPLFTGQCKNLSRQQFTDASLVFEAFCFWYADIIVTRTMRARLPDGEMANSRSAVSQIHFHPYRAFKAIGIVDPEKILNIYMTAFVGGETELYHHQDKPFVNDLFQRFAFFYVDSLTPSKLLYDKLFQMNYFGDFHNRFCNLEGIPSLLPEHISKIDAMKNLMDYCHAIRKTGFKHIDMMSEEKIARVRMRRHIQTRAYSAYSLLHSLTNGVTFSRKKSRGKSTDILVELKSYINSLETIMQALCKKNSKLNHLERILKKNDQHYSQKIQNYFKSKDIWMAQRLLLFPRLETHTSIFGIIKEDVKITKSEIGKLNKQLLSKFCSDSLKKISESKTSSAKATGRKMSALLQATSKVGNKMGARDIKIWKKAYNNLLTDPSVLKSWSIPLAAVDPENNSFREILFIYV